MGAEYRDGRPEIAPMVKDDEDMDFEEYEEPDDDLRAEVPSSGIEG